MRFDTASTVDPMFGLSRSRVRAVGVLLAATSLALFTAACNKSGPETPPVINDYVTGIQVLGDVAGQEVVNSELGQGADDGPAAKVEEAATVINGGSVQESIKSDDPFNKLRVGIEPLLSPSSSPGAETATAA